MRLVTLCLMVKGEEVLLACKKSGFGAQFWNGFGGKLKDGEEMLSGACREVFEESGLIVQPADLRKVAIIQFRFPDNPSFSQDVHTFLVDRWEGEPKETEEMHEGEWFPVHTLPLHEMWPADDLWLPLVLHEKKKIRGEVQFGGAQPPFVVLNTEFTEVSMLD